MRRVERGSGRAGASYRGGNLAIIVGGHFILGPVCAQRDYLALVEGAEDKTGDAIVLMMMGNPKGDLQ